MSKQVIKYWQGEQVYLRLLEPDDVEQLYESINSELESRELAGYAVPLHRRDIEQYIEKRADKIRFGICLQENDELIGDVALFKIDQRNRSAEFSISISKAKHMGQGYGTEATRLMLDYGFGTLNLHRIELGVFSHNKRAIKSYEKVGFKQEGIKRDDWYYNHHYHDTVIMSMLEDEYQQLYNK